jgi:hypothetical protein
VLVSAGFTEPSLVFLVGTDTVLTGNGGGAAKVLAENSCALALVDQNPAFLVRRHSTVYNLKLLNQSSVLTIQEVRI